MLELDVIQQQIEFIASESSSRALTTDEVKRLESLIRSKVLLTGNAAALPTEDNPFSGFDPDLLKKMFADTKANGSEHEN